jgi:hypothetical protein
MSINTLHKGDDDDDDDDDDDESNSVPYLRITTNYYTTPMKRYRTDDKKMQQKCVTENQCFNNGDNSSLSPKSPISQWCLAEEPPQEFEN